MSSSMLSPTNPAYRLDPPKGGILLNAIRPQSIPKSPSTSYTTPSSPSSTDSASGSEDQISKPQSNKRITFAPLPNPRAQDDIPVIVLDNSDSKLYDNPEAATSSEGDDNPAVILPDPTTRSPQLSAKKASTWSHSTKKLLKPFYKPLQKSDTSDGGALGLFRSSSRDSTASSVGTLTDSGAPLARRMSTGSSSFDVGRSAPDRSGLALHPVTSENGGVATGTRMLNGRVYGASRYRPVAQRKEADKEPEFVEWGYGGMGSNRGSSASSAYARVQSSHTNAVAAEDDDDGSGMGWVRRRREAREREKREREEREAKERQEAAAAAPPSAEPSTEPTDDAAATVANDALSASPVQEDDSALVESSSPPHESQEHITQAVRIPSHHHPKPSSSRRSSDMASGRSTPLIKQNNDSTPTVTSLPQSTVPQVGSSLRNSSTAEQVQSSEESDSDEESTEREDEPREDDDDDEEEEDSESDANMRKTSMCAGVEKISRHKD